MKRGGIQLVTSVAFLLLGSVLAPSFADDPSNYLFATSQTHAEITIIDGSIDDVVGRISLPGIAGDMTVLASGRSLAVADRRAGLVHLIDVAGRRIEREIEVPFSPDMLRADRRGTMLAALEIGTGKVALASSKADRFQTVPDISDATYMVFDVRGRLLVARPTGVTIVDAAGQPVAELTVDRNNGAVTGVAVDPGGDDAFVEQAPRGVVSVFDLPHLTRAAVLQLPAPLGRIVPSQDSQFVLAPAGEKSISVVSTWTLSETARIHIGGEPDDIGLAFFQSVATIISRSARSLMLYDLQGENEVGAIHLPGRPGLGATSSDGSRLYVALPDTGQIAAINLSTRRIDRLINDVGPGVWTILSAVGDNYCH